MTDPRNDPTEGAPPRSIHVEGEDKKKSGLGWLPWLLLALGVLALLLALSRCHRDDRAVTNQTVTTTNETTTDASSNVVGATDTVSPSTAAGTAAGVSGLGTYLQGTGAAPQTFTFEKLNFDTAKSEVRAADKAEVSQVAAVLKKYPNAHVRVVGYADARGSGAANEKLGQARADAVKAGIVAGGIDAARVETASGGETQPVDSNSTAGGQAENRRTELVVTQR